MSKPILLSVDDDRDVLRAIERDLRSQYGGDYRVVGSDSVPRFIASAVSRSVSIETPCPPELGTCTDWNPFSATDTLLTHKRTKKHNDRNRQ